MVAISNRWMKISEKDMEVLKHGINEIVVCKQKIQSNNDAIKAIVNSISEKTKIQKSVIKKVADLEYKSSYDKFVETHECVKDLWENL